MGETTVAEGPAAAEVPTAAGETAATRGPAAARGKGTSAAR